MTALVSMRTTTSGWERERPETAPTRSGLDESTVQALSNIDESDDNLRTTVRGPTDRTRSSAIISSPAAPNPTVVLAEWNGSVERVDESYFVASLKGVRGEGVRGESEMAEIPISDVSESDLELLSVGNFFRLSVCYEHSEDGQPRRFTQVVFRRLPAYRREDLASAIDRADTLYRALRVD